jgi:hypothetical protein
VCIILAYWSVAAREKEALVWVQMAAGWRRGCPSGHFHPVGEVGEVVMSGEIGVSTFELVDQ